ncbi:hypothetical protein D3C87_1465000 [compost metagenome]
MFPGNGQARGIQADACVMQERRAVITSADIILARPDGFHRFPRGLGDFHGFSDKIRGGIGPATKTAAQKLGMNLHLFRFEPGDFPRDHLIQSLKLGAGPDLAFVPGYFDGAIKRLHWRVGQVGHAVFDIDGFHRLAHGAVGVAGLAG